ncbi:LexA family protein [Streptomyces clavifer]|uniref:LexA family protein n=1 Tax=Streptomyces clavifer TaxID=68188 RepID=UPI0036C18782
MCSHVATGNRQSWVIYDWITERGEAPTVWEIGARVGLASTGSVAYQLGRLETRASSARPDTGGAPGACGPEASFLRRRSGTRQGAQSARCSRAAPRSSRSGCAICAVHAGRTGVGTANPAGDPWCQASGVLLLAPHDQQSHSLGTS